MSPPQKEGRSWFMQHTSIYIICCMDPVGVTTVSEPWGLCIDSFKLPAAVGAGQPMGAMIPENWNKEQEHSSCSIAVDGRNPARPYIELLYQKYRNSGITCG